MMIALDSIKVLGESRFDADHRVFAALIAELADAEDGQVADTLARLLTHASRHFAEEDADLLSLGGSANECHLDEHQSVLASMREVGELVRTNQFAVARALARELNNWLPLHVDELDSRLVQALFMRRTGGARIEIQKPARLMNEESV
jgi:hemerythrin